MGLVRKLKALFQSNYRTFLKLKLFSVCIVIISGKRSTILLHNINLERTGDVLAVDYLKIPIKVGLI